MIIQDEIVSIGKFQKTHALKGELNMICEIDPEYFLEGNPLIVEMDGILVPFYVSSVRPRGTTSYLVKIDGIESVEEALQFVNKEVNILKKDAEEIIEDFEEQDNLKGYKIIDVKTDEEIGEIIDIEDSTVNLLFIVKREGGEEIFIPANEDFIEEIDDEGKKIRMNLPEGLININE